MNTKTHFRISGIILIALVLIFLLSGCSTSPKSLSAKESRMSEDLLRSQVLRYKAEVEAGAETHIEEFNKVFSRTCPIDAPFTPEALAALQVIYIERDETMSQFDENLIKYYLFYEKLKEKGGDMAGLEIQEGDIENWEYLFPPIDEDLFIPPNYFSPPIEDPAPDAKTVAEV